MEREHNRKKKTVISVLVFSALAIALVVGILVFMRKEEVSFDAMDERYFYFFSNAYDVGEYEFYSLDAYYQEETGEYFYNAKFAQYMSRFDDWSDIDQVMYGKHGELYNFYCLNWDDLDGFEAVNVRFERAKKEGVHKTYTLEEIEKGIAAAREQIAKEDAEFEAQQNAK